MKRYRCLPLLITALLLSFLAFSASATPVVRGGTARAFLGGRTGKMVYTRWEGFGWKNGTSLWYVDFSEEELVERKVVEHTDAEPRNPIISEDGEWVCYNTLLPDKSESVSYICRLTENAEPIRLATGAHPHWWTRPGTDEQYIILNSGDLEQNWQNFWPPERGYTMTLRIDQTMQPIGEPAILCNFYLNAGRSKSGTLMFTSGRATGIFRLDSLAVENATIDTSFEITEKPGCNPSTSPHELDEDVRFMQLGVDHDVFFVRSSDGSIVQTIHGPSDGNPYWDTPEWSTHTDFATAVASWGNVTPPFDAYIVRLTDKASLRVIDGNVQWPHLWVGASPAGGGDTDQFNLAPYFLSARIDSGDTVRTMEVANLGHAASLRVVSTPSWLEVTVDNSGGLPTLRNRFLTSEPAPGTHEDSVVITTTEAAPETTSYRVRLIVQPKVAYVDSMLILEADGSPYLEVPQWYRANLHTELVGPESALIPGTGDTVSGKYVWTPRASTDGIWLDEAGADEFLGYGAFSVSVPTTRQAVFHIRYDQECLIFMDGMLHFEGTGTDELVEKASEEFELSAGRHTIIWKLYEKAGPNRFGIRLTDTNGAEMDDVFYSLPPSKDQPIVLESPHGGETFLVGDTVHIRWSTDNTKVTDCGIKLSTDGGRSYTGLFGTTFALGSQQWGDVAWVIPDSLEGVAFPAKHCLFQVYNYHGPEKTSMSTPFSIYREAILIESPAPGKALTIGDTLDIHWQAARSLSGPFIVELSLDGGQSWTTISDSGIAAESEGAGKFQWFIPESIDGESAASSSCLVRVSSQDDDASATSEGTFSIEAPRRRKEKRGICGSGAGLALLPPIGFRLMRRRRKKG